MTTEQLKDKCRGSLVGGAVGDALGYPVEFIDSFNEIRTKYGENGLTEYDISYTWPDTDVSNRYALVSDDTQMTLYPAEGLLEAIRKDKPIVPMICNAYLVWFGNQVGKKVKVSYKSTMSQIKRLNQRRAPGNTCLTSLFSIYSGKEPVNSSKGCGGVMRVAPIGIYGASHDWTLEETVRIAGEVAENTHQHPLSTYSSGALAVIVQQCITAENIDSKSFKDIINKSVDVVANVYGEHVPAMENFRQIIIKALELEHNQLLDWKIIENNIGGGWVAEETLAIAILSVLRHIDDFKDCLICAVNHGGDSDSTAAVAGNIIGAILGYNAIPERYKTNLELHDLIVSVADDITTMMPTSIHT